MTFCLPKNNYFILKSIVSNKLTNKEIKEICLLKDHQWKFGIKLQAKWFKNNIKSHDIHNLLYIKSKLIGYTLLCRRTCKIKNLKKKTKYLLFDTLVIDRKYRSMKLSNLLMSFNNTKIKQLGFFSFLICKKELVHFYKKYGWVKLSKKNINVVDHLFSTFGMIFNEKNFDKKYFFYINK